jgi:hypothetical protein
MRETLESIQRLALDGTRELAEQAGYWLAQMAPTRYACMEYDHCYAAVALNALTEASLVDLPCVGPHHCRSSECNGPHGSCDCKCVDCVAAKIEEEE